MTELNIAYDDYKPMNDENDYQPQMPPQQQPQMPQQQQQLPQQPPPQNNYYIQQQPQLPPPAQLPIKRNRYPEYSFWDRMAMSRGDVFKLVLLSFVIVLGISIEKLGSHYITQYLADNVLSPLQEFIVRITYPVVIFLFLWIIKSL